MNKLLDLVARAMAIAQLTQLHITIPASGSGAKAVPEECFPPNPLPWVLVLPHRVFRSLCLAGGYSGTGRQPFHV